MVADSVLSHGARNDEEDNADPSVDERSVRMVKSLTREKTKMVIARKLGRSVDAMYALASKLGIT
jgi:hypothetical protein